MDFEKNVEFELPVVITHGFVLFPGQFESLTANRDFSRNAIKDSRDNFESYCVVVSQIYPEARFVDGYDDIYHVGTIGKLQTYGDAVARPTTKILGTERVKILSIELRNKTFYAKCVLYEDSLGEENEERALISNIIEMIEKSPIEVLFQSSFQDVKDALARGQDAKVISYLFAAKVQGDKDSKQKLLEASDVNVRLMDVIKLMSRAVQARELDAKIKREIQENVDKQQKEYYLREQIKAIKKELGEDGSKDSTVIREKLDSGKYPEIVVNKIKDELSRKELMPQGTLEASLIQDYIDTVLSVPWTEKTVDNDDTKNAKRILDEDHYGLEKVKERIIEYLAVKSVKGNLKAPILCFYGPPGCGKTSLSISIARSLNREFVKCSLGGVSDEAEIRGHRRTYVGSKPGRIISLLRKAKVRNPVFLLDEIDKLSHDSFKGDPASALLEVLDPEQNSKFADNYLELEYDLSDVLFICTANDISNIPGPLLDRLELINVPSYTSIDKLHIAQGYLVKRELLNNGLTLGQVKFEDDAIFYLIDRYTREAGVRDLQRRIGKVIRKIVVENIDSIKNKDFTFTVTIKDIQKFLGVEFYEGSDKEVGNQVGIVTGLAYTDFGGDILPIEVTHYKGKGGLVVTGNLGNVMKESCQIALSYVKSKQEKYGIDPKIFEEHDIHIHFPEGAIPKDGPSAGCAITCAIISALTNKPVSGDYAMTGEVNLRGNVIRIGGLREKSLAALRNGIKTILVPENNKKGIQDLPKEITDNLNIHYIKTVDDACEILFK